MSAVPNELPDDVADPAVVSDDLDRTLERIRAIEAGRIRIRVSGLNDTGKSTALELLVGGRAGLGRGAGARTATISELMLEQSDEVPGEVAAEGRVFMVTKEGALRRARALLQALDGNDQELEDLAGRPHPSRAIVSRMIAAAKVYGFGTMRPRLEFTQESLEVEGSVSPLVERVLTTVRVPATEWDLSWAGTRAPVLIDRPGPRSGGALEAVLATEGTGQAHITLSLFTVEAARNLDAPSALGSGEEIVVLTKLNEIPDAEQIGAWLTTQEQSIAALLARPGLDDRPLSVLVAPWAFASALEWEAFDGPGSGPAWARAERARQVWAQVPVDDASPTRGALVRAVHTAFKDGGVHRLRQHIAAAAAVAPAKAIDRSRLVLEVIEGRRQLEVLRAAARSGLWTTEQMAIEKRIDNDSELPVAMRLAARSAAARAVYGQQVWGQIRAWFSLEGKWRGDGDELAGAMAGLPFEDLSGRALAAAQRSFDEAASAWFTSLDLGSPALITAEDHEIRDVEQQVVRDWSAAFVRQATGFVDGYWRGPHDEAPTFRKVARTRHELCLLLRRMIERQLLPQIQRRRDEARGRRASAGQPQATIGGGRLATSHRALAAAAATAGLPEERRDGRRGAARP